MTIPTISIGGSTKTSLLNDICNARNTLDDAHKALRVCCPHPRDYQLAQDGDYGRAREEHLDRLHRLQSVYEELEQLAIQIDEQYPDAR